MNRARFASQSYLGAFADAADHGRFWTAGCLAMAVVIAVFAAREDRMHTAPLTRL
jgi:hypothetical protein